MTTQLPAGAVAELNDILKKLHEPVLQTLPDSATGNPDILLLPDGVKAQSVKPFLDEYRARPERRSGTAKATDLASFCDLVNRHRDEDSAIFARRDMAAPQLLAVIDYHHAVNRFTEADGETPTTKFDDRTAARFGRHRIAYDFPLAEEWRGWMAHNAKALDQTEFALFLEDHLEHVLPAPDFANLRPDDAWTQEIARMVGLLGGSLADPLRLAELARGISIRADDRAEQKVDLSSGQKTLFYKSNHLDDAGQPVKVPSLFLIGIPVFDGGSAYTIAVKLRYRLSGGAVKWVYELHRPDKVFRHAFDSAMERAAAATGLPVYLGAPEQ